jgi:hypothetical protein
MDEITCRPPIMTAMESLDQHAACGIAAFIAAAAR